MSVWMELVFQQKGEEKDQRAGCGDPEAAGQSRHEPLDPRAPRGTSRPKSSGLKFEPRVISGVRVAWVTEWGGGQNLWR